MVNQRLALRAPGRSVGTRDERAGMATNSERRRARRSADEWRRVLSGFAGSGLAVEAFCARAGISDSSFYRWRSRLATSVERPDAMDHPPSGKLHRCGSPAKRRRAASTPRTDVRPRWRSAGAPGARLMFFPEGQIRVQVYGRPVDLRNSFDGLYALTRQALAQDPLSGQLFVFFNRRANQVKVPTGIARVSACGPSVSKPAVSSPTGRKRARGKPTGPA